MQAFTKTEISWLIIELDKQAAILNLDAKDPLRLIPALLRKRRNALNSTRKETTDLPRIGLERRCSAILPTLTNSRPNGSKSATNMESGGGSSYADPGQNRYEAFPRVHLWERGNTVYQRSAEVWRM